MQTFELGDGLVAACDTAAGVARRYALRRIGGADGEGRSEEEGAEQGSAVMPPGGNAAYRIKC